MTTPRRDVAELDSALERAEEAAMSDTISGNFTADYGLGYEHGVQSMKRWIKWALDAALLRPVHRSTSGQEIIRALRSAAEVLEDTVGEPGTYTAGLRRDAAILREHSDALLRGSTSEGLAEALYEAYRKGVGVDVEPAWDEALESDREHWRREAEALRSEPSEDAAFAAQDPAGYLNERPSEGREPDAEWLIRKIEVAAEAIMTPMYAATDPQERTPEQVALLKGAEILLDGMKAIVRSGNVLGTPSDSPRTCRLCGEDYVEALPAGYRCLNCGIVPVGAVAEGRLVVHGRRWKPLPDDLPKDAYTTTATPPEPTEEGDDA